ncbi:DMT family transporter [Chromobacterium phragmitis]|uniref:DMT family transporter n=1 Tax=Chromobacterium amazonense TaxID=1382803 RepID=UPI0021B7865C|nr:DMT family transporter [Chromobacterium amazonense]MBM2885851.1 DMT family transporter [Chromobacterium amazonense]MDE1715435.1 DMT family transporter [Chromobacterium amazonense]
MDSLRRDYALLILLAALWGGSFLFMRVAVPAFGPLALIALRVGLAALTLLPLMLWRRQWGLWRANWARIAVVGIFLTAFPFCLIAWAQLSLSTGMASVLNATTPLMTALWAWPLAGERLTPKRGGGLALGLAGVLVLLYGHGARFDVQSILPVMAMLAATASYGWAGHMAKRWLPGMPPLVTACGGLCSAAVLMLPLAWWRWPVSVAGAEAWWAVLLLALLSTSLAYLIYYRLINRLGATRASSVTYLVPVFGVLWGALFLSESVGVFMFAGAGLILAGVLLLGWRH